MIIDPYNFQTVKITDKQFVAEDTVVITTDKPAGYSFRPGQYAVVRTRLIRQYSFISSPNQPNLQFLIRRQPEGEVSNWFYNQAAVGDSIDVSSPLGNFIIEDTANTLLIAGGSGIAGFLSLLRQSASGLSLLYSDHTQSHLCYHEALQELLSERYMPVISSVDGRIDQSLLSTLDSYRQYYICGSKLFVDAIQDSLVSLGIPTSVIRRELFTLQ